MDQLYEKFIAEWLKVHLPQNLGIKEQERVKLSIWEMFYDVLIAELMR